MNILFCCHCLPADRAQGNAGPKPPFRVTHCGGRSANGPTTSAPRRGRSSAMPITPRPIWRDRGSIARGARGTTTRQVVSELGTTAGKRLEAGAGRVEAPSTGQHRPRSCEGRQGGATPGGGSGTSDGSCYAPVPVSHCGSAHLTWLVVARRFQPDSGVHQSVNVSVTCVGGVSKCHRICDGGWRFSTYQHICDGCLYV